MIYCDTSFVAPLIINEAASDAVEALVRQLPQGEMTVSHWTRVEFASLVARRVRLKELTTRLARELGREFDRMLDESFEVTVPRAEDFNLAATMLQNYKSGLRAGDALHLAIASNRKASRFLTLDKALVRVAGQFKVRAESGL
jgi:predicted nucleic acid-binding protein